jgi:hypothetical protein
VKGSKQVVDSCHPLRHSHVICIFGFKEELVKTAREYATDATNTSIRSQFYQHRVSIVDELKPCFLIGSNGGRTRSPVHSLDEIVVEMRRANRHLTLFQAKHAIVMPGGLAKCHKRDWMDLASCMYVSFAAQIW